MIVYVDLEHQRVQKDHSRWQKTLALRMLVKYRLEEISGENCLTIRYEQVSSDTLQKLNVHARLRRETTFVERDRLYAPEIARVQRLVEDGELARVVRENCGIEL